MPGPENLPELERFSLNYLRQGTPGSDSQRMRTRLGILISKLRLESLYELIRGRLGAPVPPQFRPVGKKKPGCFTGLRPTIQYAHATF